MLAVAAVTGSAGVLVAGAALAGLGGGAFYPLFAGLCRECFGYRNVLEVHAVVYSAKALGGLLGVGAGVAAQRAGASPVPSPEA